MEHETIEINGQNIRMPNKKEYRLLKYLKK
jgi:hypothetical protein